MIGRVAFALIVGGVVTRGASAQGTPATTPPPSNPAQAPARPAPSDVPPPPPKPVALPPRDATPLARKPAGAREERDPLSSQGRFANPGGIGTHREYYTPFTPMTSYQPHPNRVAGFGQGGGPSRSDQLDAFRAGQYRSQNIQNNINAYGRPVGFGFGYGFGRFGGYR